MGSSLIKCDHLVPNRPHKRNLFAKVCMILDMWLVELVVPWEVALPLVRHLGCVREHINDFVFAHLHGIIKKAKKPPPTHQWSGSHPSVAIFP